MPIENAHFVIDISKKVNKTENFYAFHLLILRFNLQILILHVQFWILFANVICIFVTSIIAITWVWRVREHAILKSNIWNNSRSVICFAVLLWDAEEKNERQNLM